ncbi:hypothetical protein [Sphingobium sp. BS19]|uniref:hypothetical protein n=1 Tax=Sphingobium sp. BS19 TaxID=3018973 RepID=UPI0022EDF9EF|nr:hypothetical protein [Sphingobium sp. BS19]GLJ00630.1 hypothetical protein Sbs19_44480 [Sphingobium sp. BS19]|tara:strand:- start:1223 stop:2404 length:1182 start_codon:yes stop_codon:yes gene_type:complete
MPTPAKKMLKGMGAATVALFATSAVLAQSGGDRLRVTTAMSAEYDSNILRRNPDSVAGPTDNTQFSPKVSVAMNRRFGRTAVKIDGTIGYDFNSRFKFLDRQRIIANLGVDLPVGSQCPISFKATHQQFQFDLNDINSTRSQLQIINRASVDIVCSRPGISPSIGANYATSSAGGLARGKSETWDIHGGVQLTLPSAGVLAVGAQYGQLARPGLEALGIMDGSISKRVYISIDRSVAPRFKVSGYIGYMLVNPERDAVPAFSGAAFKINSSYSFTPRLILNFSASRDAQAGSGIASTYVITEQYRGALDIDVLNDTSMSLSIARQNRRFFGNDFVSDRALNFDHIDSAAFVINRQIGTRFSVGLNGRVLKRRADLDVFEYKSLSGSASVGAKF